MRILKIVVIVAVVYVVLVATFESMLGVFQPAPGGTLVITTFGADGAGHDRVVSKLESQGKLYVAANHWPRAWYRRALANPEVEAAMGGETTGYRAVPVTGAEHVQVDRENALPLGFRFLTGFPPRYFVRLEPR